MSVISRIKTWITGDTLTASDLNAEFNNILNDYNGGITNANINASAAIAYSKISLSGSIINSDVSPSAAIAYSKLNLSGGIVNADISSGAAISASKISDTALTQTATQTASNKTFTKPILNGSVSPMTTDTDGATVTFDMSSANVHTVTLGGNRTLAVSNVTVGQPFMLILVQDGTGSRTVTWFSTLKWVTGSAPVLTTTGGKTDVFSFYPTSSGNYLGFIVGQNL